MKPLETTAEIIIDGDLIETANLVFHSVPKNECLHTQHENTKKAILNRLAEQYDRNLCREEIMTEVEEIAYWIANLKTEDTK